MSHDLSLGEVQSLAQKAARGTGRSFGMAEEAGFAVRWLCERGYDGAGHLAALLQAGEDAGCPLQLGTTLSDGGVVPPEDLPPVSCPMLLAPFVSALCDAKGGLSIAVGAAQIRVDAEGSISGAPLPDARAAVRIGPCAAPDECTQQDRAQVSEVALATLSEFAFRTYAPATEESRARGAGAGLSDND